MKPMLGAVVSYCCYECSIFVDLIDTEPGIVTRVIRTEEKERNVS